MKISVFYVNGHQRAATVQEDLNSQVDAMTPSVSITSYFSADAMGAWTQRPCGRDGYYAWVQQHGFSRTKADFIVAAIKCPMCPQKTPMLSP